MSVEEPSVPNDVATPDPVSNAPSEPIGGRGDYSLAASQQFGWSSLSRDLNPARVAVLEAAIVGNRVLDAGCGGGGYIDFLTARGLGAVGVEKYELFLGQSRLQGFNGKFVQGDLCHLPFCAKAFDTTFCFDVLEHLDDEAALKELVRVTASRIILTVPQKDERPDFHLLTYMPYLDQTHLRYYTEPAVRDLASTVDPKHIQVLPECRVNFPRLIRKEARFVSAIPGVARVYGRLQEFLLDRTIWPDWYVNWLAIIDLDEAGRRDPAKTDR
jgi:SAM-dependent methyltransferase